MLMFSLPPPDVGTIPPFEILLFPVEERSSSTSSSRR